MDKLATLLALYRDTELSLKLYEGPVPKGGEANCVRDYLRHYAGDEL